MSLPAGVRLTGTRLDPILQSVAVRAGERQPVERIAAAGSLELFRTALGAPGLSLIAECKRRAPSVGQLSKEVDLAWRAQAYARGGAAALSILTEEEHFGGHPRDLAAVQSAGLPLLRKDFLISTQMVLESVPMGADGVLLICACLEDALLEELAVCAREQGLFTLVEIHDERELERAARLDCASIGVGAIGVNARDLRDFSIDLATVERILPLIPEGVMSVAESGLYGPEDLLRVRAAGADAALVGTALMRSEDPEATLRNWREVLEV